MLPSPIFTRLLLFLGAMHVGSTFSHSSTLISSTSKVARMSLLMCCPVCLELRSCLLLCYVLFLIPLEFCMSMMSLFSWRVVPWLHLLLLFMRMILFWSSFDLSSSRVLLIGLDSIVLMLSRVVLFLFLGMVFCVSL